MNSIHFDNINISLENKYMNIKRKNSFEFEVNDTTPTKTHLRVGDLVSFT